MTAVDWVIVAILAISTLSGLASGFFRSFCSLGGLILGLAVACWNYRFAARTLLRVVHSEPLANAIAFLLLALLVMFLAGLLGALFSNTFKWLGLGWVDGLAGGILGLFLGAFLVTVGIVALAAFFPEIRWIGDAALARYFLGAAHLTSHMSPKELGDRIRWGLAEFARNSPAWLRPRG